jgi:hypothetical protein
MNSYDDNYPTCSETFATLRFYHESESPHVITDSLGINPSKTQSVPEKKISGWFLRTKDHVESKDVRRHIDWILEKLSGSEAKVIQLQKNGWRADVNCYWVSIGQGGPMLNPDQMEHLSKFKLTCGFDIYMNK